MYRNFEFEMKYYVQFYKRMGWKLNPLHLLFDCAEACYDDANDFGWRTLQHAITYLQGKEN